MIQITIPGQPVAKGRPRFRVVKSKDRTTPDFVQTYSPPETQRYEARVAAIAKQAMGATFPTSAPIEILLELRMQIPVSWTKTKRLAAAQGKVRATKKPDADNMLKAVTDACNGILWADDSQIVVTTVRKLYHAEPCVIMAVREVEGESA